MSDSEEETNVALFNEAANVVQANATGQSKKSPSDSQLLELYGLYKVATCGPCNVPQPGILNMKARSKWSSWKNKSELSKETAMNEYVNTVMSIYDWTPASDDELTGNASNRVSTGFGPAVSTPKPPEDVKSGNTPFDWVKDNEINKVTQWIKKDNPDINLTDEDGLSLLHWAVDRGRIQLCEILLRAGADPNRKDEDDQTPLDYAVTCDHHEIIQLLQKVTDKGKASAT